MKEIIQPSSEIEVSEEETDKVLSSEEIEATIYEEVSNLMDWISSCDTVTFNTFEKQLCPKVFSLGCLFMQFFLCLRNEQFQAEHPEPLTGYKRVCSKSRLLGTVFGKVRYWRTYFYRKNEGYYPFDIELGLTGDGFSMSLQSLATRIATKMSYAQTVVVLSMFLNWSPAQGSVESMVLGLGRHTGDWFEAAPAPEGDGEVLIIQIDSKAAPTATEEELKKRRGPRRKNSNKGSKRHRGRKARKRRGSKKRRKKGDKSKNGKMATIVTMYTLKRNADGELEGPINKKVYASFAPKRHAVAIARREANKRGFGPESEKTIQIVTDGDNDLECYIDEYFPEVEHTIDVFHVIEYLWSAGQCLYKEGSDELIEWVETQKDSLYDDRAQDIVDEIDKQLARFDPSKVNARKRLLAARNYLSKRIKKMEYKRLRDQDLEISSGAVEGAVKHVIAKRFDNGGMRWIKERAEHLLQLRCIEINDDWDAFIDFVHDRTQQQAQNNRENIALKRTKPTPLPSYGLT